MNRLDEALGKLSTRMFGTADFASVEVEPDAPEPTPEPLTPAEEWDRLLERMMVPTAYRVVPRSVALPKGLANWRGDPWGVFLNGPTGCGKTWIAVRLLAEVAMVVDRGDYRDAAMFADSMISLAKIQDEMRSDEPNRTVNRMIRASVLLLDDLGAERGTDYQADKLNLVLRARHLAQSPTIITSNVASVDKATTAAIASRLAAGVFPISGRDRRMLRPT